MAFDPMAMMQMKKRLDLFKEDHPKVFPFFSMIRSRGLVEGAVYELKVTTPDGQEYVTNIRLNANDIETIGMIANAR